MRTVIRKKELCEICKGTGYLMRNIGQMKVDIHPIRECPKCNGTGELS